MHGARRDDTAGRGLDPDAEERSSTPPGATAVTPAELSGAKRPLQLGGAPPSALYRDALDVARAVVDGDFFGSEAIRSASGNAPRAACACRSAFSALFHPSERP